MAKALVEDRDAFHAFLASQPLCIWMAQKQHAIAMGAVPVHGKSSVHTPSAAKPKPQDAELAAALSSMA